MFNRSTYPVERHLYVAGIEEKNREIDGQPV